MSPDWICSTFGGQFLQFWLEAADECAIRSRRRKWAGLRSSKKLRNVARTLAKKLLAALAMNLSGTSGRGRAQGRPLLNYVSINFLSPVLTISPGSLIWISHHLGEPSIFSSMLIGAQPSDWQPVTPCPCLLDRSMLWHFWSSKNSKFSLQKHTLIGNISDGTVMWNMILWVGEISVNYLRKFLINLYVNLVQVHRRHLKDHRLVRS